MKVLNDYVLKLTFWNVSEIIAMYGYVAVFISIVRSYQEDIPGLSAWLYQLKCIKRYCYVEVYRPVSSNVWQCQVI